MIEEIYFNERGQDSPGISWIRDITIVNTKDKETWFIKWVKVYKKGWTLPPDSVAKTYIKLKDAQIL